uniref:PH domain-containing protein n=1 Tax=Poecilia mexicana TaxID=48701 RepID=A0A3B3YZ97_9TELE
MRTYYFCTDTSKEMESWMKVMTDAALVHTEPVKRLDKLNMEQQTPQQWNNLLNHTALTQPEIQNNERNREPVRQHSLSRADEKRLKDIEKQNSQKEREYYTLQRDGEKYSLKKDGVSYMLQKDGDRYLLHKDGERYLLRKDGEKYTLQKDVENYAVQKVNNKYTVTPTEDKYAPSKDGEKFLLTKDGEKYALQKVGDRHMLQKDGQIYVPQKEVKRQLSLKETERYSTMRDTGNKYGTIQIVDKYGNLKEVRKYSTLREGNKYASVTNPEKYATIRAGEKYFFQRDPSSERPSNNINSIKLQPAQAAAIAAAVTASRQNQANVNVQKPLQMNRPGEQPGDCGQITAENTVARIPLQSPAPVHEPDFGIPSANSMQHLEPRVRVHRTRELDDDTRSVMSYQTLPRNMPSHRTQIVPCFPEGYRTLPRNSMMRPDSICSVAGSVYDRALRPVSSTISTAEKRRSMRDDTMWQLYEWQQRQAFSRQSLAQPAAVGHYGTLPSTKTMGNISEHAVARSISTSPSHGSLALYNTFSPPHQQAATNPSSSLSEVSSPVLRGDGTLDHRQRSHLSKITPEDFKDSSLNQSIDKADVETKLSRLCEKDKVLKMQEEKLQQLHREKHTLETVLMSASQELGEQSGSNTAAMQSLVQQRDVLQSGLLSTCRELSRVTAELERLWTEYEQLEADVTLARTNLLEQLEALGSPQTEPPSQRHIQIQKELWRIQDVMEALTKTKPQQRTECGFPGSTPLSSLQKNEAETLLPPSPLKEGIRVPARPPLPQCYDSECIPHTYPHHSQPGSRPLHAHRPEERKASSRNGAHSVRPV